MLTPKQRVLIIKRIGCCSGLLLVFLAILAPYFFRASAPKRQSFYDEMLVFQINHALESVRRDLFANEGIKGEGVLEVVKENFFRFGLSEIESQKLDPNEAVVCILYPRNTKDGRDSFSINAYRDIFPRKTLVDLDLDGLLEYQPIDKRNYAEVKVDGWRVSLVEAPGFFRNFLGGPGKREVE